MDWLNSASRLVCAPSSTLFGVAGAVIGLAGVQIVAADLAEKNLALHAKAAVGSGVLPAAIKPRDHLELRTQAGGEGRAALGRGDFRRKTALVQ